VDGPHLLFIAMRRRKAASCRERSFDSSPGHSSSNQSFLFRPQCGLLPNIFTYNNSARPGVSGTGIPRQENIEAILLQLPHGFHLMRFTCLIIRPGSGWTAPTFCTSVPTAWRIGRNWSFDSSLGLTFVFILIFAAI
jgi:hypothetical protein